MSERCRNCGKPRDAHQKLCHPCMIAVWDQRYRPPARLERGEFFVSVARVHESSGVRDHETRWGTLSIGFATGASAAVDAAKAWYRDTDQATDAELSLRVRRDDGKEWVVRVRLEMELASRIVEVPRE